MSFGSQAIFSPHHFRDIRYGTWFGNTGPKIFICVSRLFRCECNHDYAAHVHEPRSTRNTFSG